MAYERTVERLMDLLIRPEYGPDYKQTGAFYASNPVEFDFMPDEKWCATREEAVEWFWSQIEQLEADRADEGQPPDVDH